ncbi:MAG: helix-turn-helix transcriptional regulator [Leptolyngbyaceae cyanobacterium RU_5_1]|nr:helix-turn-helix transcriptional regulator [Leptolyngbyaceae cyanobacterium RU_5_1]
MTFEDVYQFFQSPPPSYLNQELTVCFVLSILLKKDSYGTELIQLVGNEYPGYRLSDTVLYSALKFLEQEAVIAGYWQKLAGRGRPRRMYTLLPNMQTQSEELAHLWQVHIAKLAGSIAGSTSIELDSQG